jgi:hypothetical protein
VFIEQGIAFERHDQVDLTRGVRMMRADDIVHVDHIDRKPVQFVIGFEYPAVTNAAGFVLAQPALVDSATADCIQTISGFTACPMLLVQPIL